MSVSFSEAVSPEGSERFVLHCYFSTSANTNSLINHVQEAASAPITWFDLTESEEEMTLVLVEVSLNTMQEFVRSAATLLQFTKYLESVEIAVLMFDGAFLSSDQLLDDSIANQIYGISTRTSGPVLCLDRDILRSEHWRGLVGRLRAENEDNADR